LGVNRGKRKRVNILRSMHGKQNEDLQRTLPKVAAGGFESTEGRYCLSGEVQGFRVNSTRLSPR